MNFVEFFWSFVIFLVILLVVYIKIKSYNKMDKLEKLKKTALGFIEKNHLCEYIHLIAYESITFLPYSEDYFLFLRKKHDHYPEVFIYLVSKINYNQELVYRSNYTGEIDKLSLSCFKNGGWVNSVIQKGLELIAKRDGEEIRNRRNSEYQFTPLEKYNFKK